MAEIELLEVVALGKTCPKRVCFAGKWEPRSRSLRRGFSKWNSATTPAGHTLRSPSVPIR